MEIAQIIAENTFHLEHHFGTNFGLGIIPLSLALFLIALYLAITRKQKTSKVNNEIEEKIRELETQMVKFNENEHHGGL